MGADPFSFIHILDASKKVPFIKAFQKPLDSTEQLLIRSMLELCFWRERNNKAKSPASVKIMEILGNLYYCFDIYEDNYRLRENYREKEKQEGRNRK
jgi:hypothetical protein